MIVLSPGANTALTDARTFTVTLSTTRGHADLFALLLDAREQADGDAVVFYNSPRSPDGSVTLEPAADRIAVAVADVPAAVDRILFVAQADDTPNLAAVGSLRLVVATEQGEVATFELEPPPFPTVRGVEIYRRGAAWKLRALGDGYADGLPKLLAIHGVTVDDEPAAPSRAATPGAPASVASASVAPAPASASASAAPTPTPASAAAMPPSAASEVERDVAPLGTPSLTAALPDIDRWHQISAAGYRVWGSSCRDALDAMAEGEPDTRRAIAAARDIEQQIKQLFDSRYASNKPGKSRPGLMAGGAPLADGAAAPRSLDEWTTDARATLRELTQMRLAVTDGGKAKDAARIRPKLGSLLARRPLAEHAELRLAWEALQSGPRRAAEAELEQRGREMAHHLSGAPPLPPIVGTLGEGAMDGTIVPGVGPLRVQVGFAIPTAPVYHLRRPADMGVGTAVDTPVSFVGVERGFGTPHLVNRSDPRTAGPFGFPLVLDLDVAGGFLTDHAVTANNVLLRLLALLPAGQLKATIFDPVKLGESASFLFGLGDAAEPIIGTKVRTTERELGELLGEFEEHITFVTQKYLQGTYESLTDYNVAAGEVSEPYRALVLYDYPKGFLRADGHVDQESLSRLTKIVQAGRRCGVFTIAVVPSEVTAGKEVWVPLWEVPFLVEGQQPHADWFTSALVGRNVGCVADRAAPAEPTEALLPSFGGTCGEVHHNLVEAAAAGAKPLFSHRFEGSWVFRGDEPAAESTIASILAAIKRGLVVAEGVRVASEHVAHLVRAQLARDVAQGVRGPEELPLPSDDATWWHGSSSSGVLSSFGRVGATDVATLPLDNGVPGVVIGGRPGSGKSVLLHAMVSSWVTRYSPEELSLYLVDFKEGIEFKGYASGALPHAEVIAIESDREFGVSVLRRLVDEIGRRGSLFKEGSGEEINIAEYRSSTGQALPRIVCVIDEFHVLFERDDATAATAGELMEKVVRLGRAFGVHLVLASQTLSGTAGLGRHTLGLLPGRIALQSSDADSRLLLADDNADARLLTRPGEGILNLRGGLKDANQRFQAAFAEVEDRLEMIDRLRRLADARGFTGRPIVFQGSVPVTVADLPADAFVTESTGTLTLPVGLPLTLDGPVLAELRREPGGNLLVVTDEAPAADVLAVLAGTLQRSGVPCDFIDYGAPDAALSLTYEALAAGGGGSLTRRRGAPAKLQEVLAEVEQRQELSDYRSPARVLFVSAIHRARDFELGDEAQLLESIVRDGPDVGIHVIVWADKPVSLGRRLSTDTIRELGVRIVGTMSRDDAFAITESDLPSQLTAAQLVLDDHDRALTVRARRILRPDDAWFVGGVLEST